MENKEKICKYLLQTLQETRHGCDLIDIRYEKDMETETVTMIYVNGYKVSVNVSMDSGIAMIRDIIRAL